MTDIMQHHWSGWPGAMCLHCGSADPMEVGFVDGLYNIDENMELVWRDEIAKLQVKKDLICKIGFSENCGQCKANKNG